MKRAVILFALVFSGLTALVYQILWTRLLGFAFGTTTEAISILLAVFFGGFALGNLAARGDGLQERVPGRECERDLVYRLRLSADHGLDPCLRVE